MPIGRNICKFARPPGGEANCSKHQLAICRVEGGVLIRNALIYRLTSSTQEGTA
jgi:hypothetical protein